MFKTFYSLAKTPFSKEIQTENAYGSIPFRESMARLDYLKKTRGIGLMVGEPGVGKTFALRTFSQSLHTSRYQVIYFPLSTGTVTDFYRAFAFGLGEEPKSRKVDLFRQIQQAIETLFQQRKITPVLILDEMQAANHLFLTDISMLFNFHMDSENPFILILAGLPYLRDRLSRNQHRPLAQRLVMQYKIESLDKEEVVRYIAHHMQLSGANHPIFTEVAMEGIASLTHGCPRLINNLATHCLLYGYQMKKEQIDEEIVRIVAQGSDYK
jgi:type II secretory pathway predicted ATPase ExeA